MADRIALPMLARATLLVFVTGGGTFAQDPLHVFSDGAGDFGGTTASAGDLDLDGVVDWAVRSGSTVRLYSGLTGAPLPSLVGPSDAGFGRDMEGLGDVDLDGFPDLVVGAPDHLVSGPSGSVPSGAAFVRGGNGGAPIFTHLAPGPDEQYGGAVAALGDLDLDGHPDYAIAAAFSGASSGTNEGRVEVRSGKDGSLLHAIVGTTVGGNVGTDVASIGDLDLDGRSEFAVGAARDVDPTGKRTGVVRVHDGQSFGVVAVFHGLAENDRFGQRVEGAGDANGDGVPDLIVAAPYEGGFRGVVRVFSGAGGALLHHVPGELPSGLFGLRVARIFDADGDGADDFLAAGTWFGLGQPQSPAYARIYSGVAGKPIRRFEANDLHDLVGAGASAAGDVDGDGLADVLLGRPRAPFGGTGAGTAEVRRGCGATVLPYGAGCPGSGGFVPTLQIGPCPTPGLSTTLTLGLGKGGSTALVFAGSAPASIPLAGGCTFLLATFAPAPIAVPLTPGGPGGGGATVPLVVPSSVTAPVTVHLQAFVVDAGTPLGAAGTAGVSIAFD